MRAFSVNEACERLRCSRANLYRRAAAGDIRLIKFGNRTLVAASEVARILSGGVASTGAAASTGTAREAA